jgi:hypothetical protein
MSNIDAQIKALLLKKKKIDYVSYVADLIKNDTKCLDFKDVQDEVVSKIEPFLLDLMTAIEGDAEVKAPASVSGLSPEELSALKLVANKVLTKTPTPANNGAFNQDAQPAPKKQEMNANDKMNFALNNRHLGNKRVQVINDQNVQIFGTVVGLDAPFVIVKTETGPTIQVPLEKVVPTP